MNADYPDIALNYISFQQSLCWSSWTTRSQLEVIPLSSPSDSILAKSCMTMQNLVSDQTSCKILHNLVSLEKQKNSCHGNPRERRSYSRVVVLETRSWQEMKERISCKNLARIYFFPYFLTLFMLENGVFRCYDLRAALNSFPRLCSVSQSGAQ